MESSERTDSGMQWRCVPKTPARLRLRPNVFRWACPDGNNNWRATTSRWNPQWLSVRLARTEATTVHEIHPTVAASVRTSRTESCLCRISEVADPVVVPPGQARRKPKLDTFTTAFANEGVHAPYVTSSWKTGSGVQLSAFNSGRGICAGRRCANESRHRAFAVESAPPTAAVLPCRNGCASAHCPRPVCR